MAIFQQAVLKSYISNYGKNVVFTKKIDNAWKEFIQYYGNIERIQNIRMLKEENYQEGFLREIFVDVLGYTINPDPDFNLTTEFKNEKDSKKADGAIVKNGNAVAVIELKSTKTIDMLSIESQAFNYKRNHKGCRYVITSNFEKLHFYLDDYSVEYEEFNLFKLKEDFELFKKFYLILSMDSIFTDLPIKLKAESINQEIQITSELYNDYSRFKTNLYNDLVENNDQIEKITLLKLSQKIFDRLLFILFSEDRGLLPPNTLKKIVIEYTEMKEKDEYKPLYYFLKKYFTYIDVGCNRKDLIISQFNGELFKPDESIDTLIIPDTVLLKGIEELSKYDFLTDIDVDILGHIFENSLTDIEQMQSMILGIEFDEKEGKRKKDGVFYTPKFITQYIVNSTLGEICIKKKIELKITEIDLDISKEYKKLSKNKKILLHNLILYRNFLLSLKIVDPACGSGAFLIQALNLLIKEHQYIEQYRRVLEGDTLGLWEIEKNILENNLYGVDINEEAVEIAKLSLWLRTAENGRKLNNLASHIICGNSLIDDKKYDYEKAFTWESKFPYDDNPGKFDVVIGNPPYVRSRDNRFDLEKKYYEKEYKLFTEKPNLYLIFMEKAIDLLKPNGYFGFIIPNSWLGIESAEPLRKYLLANMSFKSVINLLGKSFPGVNVETSILVYQNEKQNDETYYQTIFEEGIINSNFEKIRQENWLQNRSAIIDIKSIGEEGSVIDRMIESSPVLSENYNVFVGLQAYEKGKGKPKQSEECVKKHLFDYDYKYDENTYRYLNGSDVQRYSLCWSGQWLRYGEWLSQPRDLEIFSSPRILIREITSPFPNSLNCTYTEEMYLNNKSILNIIASNENCSLKYLLAILNSSLTSFFIERRAVKGNRNLFPKVVAEDLKNIPIKIAEIQDREYLETLVDEIMNCSNLVIQQKGKYISRVKSTFINVKITNKLECFNEFKYSVFVMELKKQRIHISLKEQDEWEDYFNEYITKINEYVRMINSINKRIDLCVFKIYSIPENEIDLITKNI